MRYLLIFFQVLYTVYAFLLFTGFLLLIFPLVIVASFFGKIRGGNFIYGLCWIWALFFLRLLGIRYRESHEVPYEALRQYVFIFNHISYLDIPLLMISLHRQHFRVLGKAALAKIPVFGFLYKKAVVSVDRENAIDRAKSVLQLKSVLSKGISIVISPEGTFNLTGKPLKEFYDGAFRIAIETQTPVKPILFPDNYARLHYKTVFSLNPGIARAVFLEEVATTGLTLNDLPVLKEKIFKLMGEGLIRYKAGWVKGATGE